MQKQFVVYVSIRNDVPSEKWNITNEENMNNHTKEVLKEVLHDGVIISDCKCSPSIGEDCVCELDNVHVEVTSCGEVHVWPYTREMDGKYYHPEWYSERSTYGAQGI
jgi:hypothetical protein